MKRRVTRNFSLKKWMHLKSVVIAVLFQTACTGQIAGSFRLLQQFQTFSSQQAVNTKIDLLWIVDNSSSMDTIQQKLRAGFQAFAATYMQPTWDIRVAVITTDTYMANPVFSGYLAKTVPTSVGYTSAYIAGRKSTFVNPSWNASLVNLTTGAMDSGFNYGALDPLWGPSYARLLPGMHDGPLTALCFEPLPYFFNGVANCRVRDNQALYSGISHCISPNTAAGESSFSQCVNTVENDTVRSGLPILSTMPPAGTAGDATWTQQLINNFLVNVSTGSSGQGSERGLSSVLQLISDNETTSTAFFRQGSLRGLIFVSDEDDQSQVLPDIANVPATFGPNTGYACDQSTLLAVNGASRVTGVLGYCCNVAANSCLYGDSGLTCPSKTVDGYTYTLGVCVNPNNLIPVATVKQQLDTFFTTLDGAGTTDPNYFVAAIVPMTGAAIQSLQTSRLADGIAAGITLSTEADLPARYIALSNLVGSNSLVLDITQSNFSPILDQIGAAILLKKSTFTLARVPTGTEQMQVFIIHQNGSQTLVPTSYYTLQGKSLIITQPNYVLSLASTDQISINYQPKSVY